MRGDMSSGKWRRTMFIPSSRQTVLSSSHIFASCEYCEHRQKRLFGRYA